MDMPKGLGVLTALLMVLGGLTIAASAGTGADDLGNGETTPGAGGDGTQGIRDGMPGMSVFMADFMDERGAPYPFDVVISDGETVKSFRDVTTIDTMVPMGATYTMTYDWRGGEMIYRFDGFFEREGQTKMFDFFALDPEALFIDDVRMKPFILFEEEGADPEMEWSWDDKKMKLRVELTKTPGKLVGFDVGIDGDIFEPPNYAVKSVKFKGGGGGGGGGDNTKAADGVKITDYHWSGDEFPTAPPNCHEGMNIEVTASAQLAEPVYEFDFDDLDPGDEPIGIGDLLIEHAALEDFEVAIIGDDGKPEKPGHLYPQYALPAGMYTNSIAYEDAMGTEVMLDLPLKVVENGGAIIEYRPELPAVGSDEWQGMMLKGELFGVVASSPFESPRHWNLVHDMDAMKLSVDVSAAREYDWWGYMVLPDGMFPDTVMVMEGKGEWMEVPVLGRDVTMNRVGGMNVAVMRIGADVTELAMTYAGAGDKLSGVLSELEDAMTGMKDYDKLLEKALDHVEKALDDKNWNDDGTPDDKKGEKVFDEMEKAVKELQKIAMDDEAPSDLRETAMSGTMDLVWTARMLAADGYMELMDMQGEKKADKDLEKAGKEMAKAQKELDDGDYDKAVKHYGKAWEKTD